MSDFLELESSQERKKSSGHVPVLLKEVIEALTPRVGGFYVDATFGGGGYTEALLSHCSCHVWGVDRDPQAIERAQAFEKKWDGSFCAISSRFGDLGHVWEEKGLPLVDGIVFDLGVSSFQLEAAERGFSFRLDGPLDMRMTPSGLTAADVVNEAHEEELADIFYYYGEERKARSVARAIVAERKKGPFKTTTQLAQLIRRFVPFSGSGIDPATRCFQALRIYVNQEMQELENGLLGAARLLKPGGRLVVVSFHSLEDRFVKEFFEKSEAKWGEVFFTPLFKKPVMPGEEEQRQNRRSRSARLRAGIRRTS